MLPLFEASSPGRSRLLRGDAQSDAIRACARTSLFIASAECSKKRAPADSAHQGRRCVKLVREREDQVTVPVNPVAGSGRGRAKPSDAVVTRTELNP